MLRITLASSAMLAAVFLHVCVCRASATERTDESTGGATSSVTPTPAPARRTRRLVYTCRDGKIIVFADRPCGEASILRSLDVVTPAQTGRPPVTEPEPTKASTRPAPQQASRARTLQETADKCEQLKKAVDQVDDRMRAGYPAREAGRLWQRWRDAKEALRVAEC